MHWKSYPRQSQIHTLVDLKSQTVFVKQIVIKTDWCKNRTRHICLGFILKKIGLVQESNPTYVSDFEIRWNRDEGPNWVTESDAKIDEELWDETERMIDRQTDSVSLTVEEKYILNWDEMESAWGVPEVVAQSLCVDR